MAKGAKPKDDNKKSADSTPNTQDTLSPVDRGKDFIPAGGS